MNLIKLPFASDEKNSGTKKAPEEIIRHLQKFPLTEDHLFPNFQIQEIPSFADLIPRAKQFFQQSAQNLFLGGCHSLTFPLFQAFSQAYQNPGLILFDAHPDASGENDLLPSLINNRLFKRENLLLIGLRNFSPAELAFLKKHQIKCFPMKEIALEGCYEVSEAVMSIARNFGALYVSIDIDVLDPAFAPGTACPEPGGLTARELLFFLHRLKKLKNFKAADLMEINPELDPPAPLLRTPLLGAKIITELF